jgi:hypothetical protein
MLRSWRFSKHMCSGLCDWWSTHAPLAANFGAILLRPLPQPEHVCSNIRAYRSTLAPQFAANGAIASLAQPTSPTHPTPSPSPPLTMLTMMQHVEDKSNKGRAQCSHANSNCPKYPISNQATYVRLLNSVYTNTTTCSFDTLSLFQYHRTLSHSLPHLIKAGRELLTDLFLLNTTSSHPPTTNKLHLLRTTHGTYQ